MKVVPRVFSLVFWTLNGLRLKNISLPETFCIDAPSLHLETLILHDCYGVKTIEVSSIGLTTFEYIGRVKSFTFLNVPQLEKVHIRFMRAYLNGTWYMFNGLANDLPRLQTLSLVLTTVEVLEKFGRFFSVFINLSTCAWKWNILLLLIVFLLSLAPSSAYKHK